MSDDQHSNMATDAAAASAADRLGEREAYSPFPVVGIGASAGGLEALRQLFSELPERTGMAFVVVVHLDPEHESRMSGILGKSTSMPVVEASDGMRIEPDHVYVIPPNRNMAVAQGGLHVTARTAARGRHLPVDHLFRSLAETQQARAIGVILSGMGSDGTQGVAEIKAVGGITFAQDERSAVHSGMPRSAIDSGSVDFILSPEEIAKRLEDIGSHPYLAEDSSAATKAAEDHYQSILRELRGVAGVDFSLYRDTTIRRRIMRRMALHTDRSLAEYLKRLEADGAEVEALYHDILITVTSFFRDPETFEALKTVVFPEIIKGKAGNAPIRIWVPGCSTGQEAYSLAMVLIEFLDDKPVHPPIQIFATDLSEPVALEKARAGVYPENIEAEITPERLRRFFKKEDHVYRIEKYIRDMCVFARQNLIADPPFSHVDLISCRNVLIYMAPALQRRVLPMFHYALNTPGYIVLGSSETIGEFSEMFEAADRRHKIYAKKPAPGHAHLFPVNESYKQLTGTALKQPGSRGWTPAEYQREADRILVGRYAPPGVLVNETFDIIQFRGRTSAYLEPPPGEPTTNVLKMSRDGLFLDLRSALEDAKRNCAMVLRESRVRDDHGIRAVKLQVLPVKPAGAETPCFLVIFEEPSGQPGTSNAASEPGITGTAASSATGMEAPPPSGSQHGLTEPGEGSASDEETDAANGEAAHLRQELSATREYLQSLLEQQDAANEELRSANEEILSSNEELQSTNEELQTAKEELQSANEELSTVNEQLQYRNVELNQITNDLTNLLASTTIPLVMVGNDLRIRRLTPPARQIMNLLPSDVGRPIGDIKTNVDVPEFERRITEVIESVQVQQQEVRGPAGHWFLLRIHPYRTADHKIDGAVIVLLDINELKRSEQALRASEERLHAVLDTLADGVVIFDGKGRVLTMNPAAQRLYAVASPSDMPQHMQQLLSRVDARQPDGRPLSAEDWPESRALRGEMVKSFQMAVSRPGTGVSWTAEYNAIPIREANGENVSCVVLTIRDITARKPNN